MGLGGYVSDTLKLSGGASYSAGRINTGQIFTLQTKWVIHCECVCVGERVWGKPSCSFDLPDKEKETWPQTCTEINTQYEVHTCEVFVQVMCDYGDWYDTQNNNLAIEKCPFCSKKNNKMVFYFIL